jgi:mannitol-1-/sugar-/sorbitol-6-phosphatase
MDATPAAGMVTIHPRGILFDMDGVLVSSLGSVERSWEKWAEARGVDPAVAVRIAQGRRAIETVRLLRPDLNDLEELEWIEAMEVEDKVGLETMAGVERILQALPEKYWTVVTSATERLARSRMEHGGIRAPAHIVSAETVTHGKPHPEPYLKGAELLGFAPGKCLVIEDSASGVQAGRAAGAKVLATLYSHPLASLVDADWVVQSLEDMQVEVKENSLEVRFTPVERTVAVALS